MNDLILRFIVAVETIGNALTAIANNGTSTDTAPSSPAAEKPARGRKTAEPKPVGEPKPGDPAPTGESKPADPTPAAEPAKPAAESKPAFDYEKLKKAIVELANAGTEGKEAALRILTDAGLERGQKANEAPATKWPGMYEQAKEALAKINDPSNLA